jgi:iron(III) transport system substrate-binding protein
MMRKPAGGAFFAATVIAASCAPACREDAPGRAVVVYASVDRVYAEPVLAAFEAASGIRVRPVYDLEAAKTVGLANRLLAERTRPRADLFWSGEIVQTLRLKEKGVLARYRSPASSGIPDRWRDPDGYWTGFAGRARVFIVNTRLLSPEDYPKTLDDMLDEGRPADTIGLALPLFGTTATHAAALYAVLGPGRARRFFESVRDRGLRILDGNSVVRDLVASGQLAFGLTDTDDACGALRRGAPVAVVYPDQGEGGAGTLVIPTTVAIVAGGPHPAEARALVDHLLSPGVEGALVASGWAQVPFRANAAAPACVVPPPARTMDVGYPEMLGFWERAQRELREIFVR